MRVSLEWLNQYVSLEGLTPEGIADALTNAGLEVESIERIGGAFSNVVVGRVLALNPHPNADKLRLVTVDLGAEQVQVVCGAPNVRENLLIPFAQLGAQVVNRKDGTLFTLEKAKIRGVESTGMICSLDELGLQDQYPKGEDGIWPLTGVVAEDSVGHDLKLALGLQADTVLEVAPTANRGDWMSLLGIAREVAALFDREVRTPDVFHLTPVPSQSAGFFVQLHDPEVCGYYGGMLLRNVQVGPSPAWMTRRLEAAGIRSINNVVDITNYVLLEMGQPLHAFDKDKLGYGGEISVRRARPEEPLKTLDGETRTLTPEAVVITANQKPVALAGVMGGEETEVDANTRTVFLESAFFPPAVVRRSSQSVGLRTEASARFERGVDSEACRKALYRAAALLREHAGAELLHLVESPPKAPRELVVHLRYKRIEKLLGVAIEKDTLLKVLKKLGFLFKPTKESDIIVVSVPSFRQQDVSREIDLIEEIIRIYGYDNVPYTLPKQTVAPAPSPRMRYLHSVRSLLGGAGLQEVVTNSLIGPALLERTGFALEEARRVAVNNSHSPDHRFLRQSLLPNLLEIARFNQSQGNDAVWIYELGRTYFKMSQASEKHAGVVEKLHFSALLTGNAQSGQWRGRETVDFYTLKGIVAQLADALQIALTYEPARDVATLHPGKSARLLLAGKAIGLLGELHPVLRETLKFRDPVYVFELDGEALYKQWRQAAPQPVATLSPYPPIQRDMAFLVPESVTHQQVVAALNQVQEPLVRDITLFDEYRGDKLPPGQRSLAYRLTLRSDAETLTDALAEAAVSRLKDALVADLGVTFR